MATRLAARRRVPRPADPTVAAAISRAANDHGVPVDLAYAVAYQESRFNPTEAGDRGYFRGGRFYQDASAPPTSFGLFQLHQGGELGNLTPTQAEDPYTNASVALAKLGAVLKLHPGATYGQAAAIAQGPADPAGYAASIDAMLGPSPVRDGTGSSSGPGVAGQILHGAEEAGNILGNPAGAAAEAVGIPNPLQPITDTAHALGAIGTFFQSLSQLQTWVRVLYIGGGLVAVGVGVSMLAKTDAGPAAAVAGAAAHTVRAARKAAGDVAKSAAETAAKGAAA